MAVRAVLGLALLTYKVWLATVSASLRMDGVVGESAYLSADIPSGFDAMGIIWRHVSSTEKLVTMSFKGSPETRYQSRFFGRTRLFSNFTLEISKLELGDSGTFKASLVDTGGQIETHTVILTVYEMVSKPTVGVFTASSDGNHSAKPSCDVLLTCTTERGTDVSYSWRRAGDKEGTLSNETHAILHNGRILQVRLEPTDWQVLYSCMAFNPVSQDSSAVTPWDSCQEKSDAVCAVDEYKYILFIVLPVLVVLVSAVIIWIVRLKCSGKKRKKAAEDGVAVEAPAV